MFSWGKAKPADGPYFLEGGYPEGFQPLRPESSLRNAFAVVQSTGDALRAHIDAQVAPNSLSEHDQRLWEQDHEQSLVIYNKITALIVKIEILNECLTSMSRTELMREGSAVLAHVENVVDAACSGIDELLPMGAQSLIALNALSDVLNITRRSIPEFPALKDYKEQIRDARSAVLLTKSNTERIISIKASTNMRESVAAVKGAEQTSQVEDETSSRERGNKLN